MLIRNYSETRPHALPRGHAHAPENVYRPSPVWIWYV